MSIGIFDSGVGGLTVVRAFLQSQLNVSIIYFGDTARFPYGDKSAATVREYAVENTAFLMEKGAKAVIVACNTATAAALPHLQKTFSIPIIGVIEAAVQEAIQKSRTKRIGVIGTYRTIQSGSYKKALLARDPEVKVFSRACPLLVSVIEEGALPERTVRDIVSFYLTPLRKSNIDTLILGCTHYPLIEPMIQEIVSENVTIIDPAKACVHAGGFLVDDFFSNPCERVFYVSDDPRRFKKVSSLFLQQKIGPIQLKISRSL